MTSELKGIVRGTMKQVLAIVGLTAALIFLVLLWDFDSPEESILWIYNNIYFGIIFFMGVLFPVFVWQYILVSLQFGADRRTLYFAIEKMGLFIIVLCLLSSIGMNEFGKQIYGVLGMGMWEMSIGYYIIIPLESMVLLKYCQYLLYRNIQEEEKHGTIKHTVFLIGILMIGMITLFQGKASIIETMLEPVQMMAVVVTFAMILGIIIVWFGRKNYQLFMQREV